MLIQSSIDKQYTFGEFQIRTLPENRRLEKKSLNWFVVFYISIKNDRKRIRLKVEKVEETGAYDKYRITAKNQIFVLQSNRPLFRGKGLMHRRIDWKVIEGGFHNTHILKLITKEIQSKIE